MVDAASFEDALYCTPFFIVGCPRSGTTLLRLMLDSHPSLAIPDESSFIVDLRGWRGGGRSPAVALERALAHPRFSRWGLDPAVVRRMAAAASPSSYAEAMRVMFAAYAASQRKSRWGDKTAIHVAHIPLLAKLFPTAQFIHLIRDGREVAVSSAERDWGPRTPIAGALLWRRWVGTARAAGQRLEPERYLEVRLEQLIATPESVLRGICDFLGEQFAPEMLEYHDTAEARVWSDAAGARRHLHRHVALPPTAGLRDWRAGLSAAQQAAVEAAAQPLLGELGYAAQRFAPTAAIRARLDWLRWLPFHATREALKQVGGFNPEPRFWHGEG